MLNLLNTEFYKLFHSRYFWGIVAFNLFLSSVLLLDSIGETSSLFFASLYNVPILFFLAIVFSALFVGNDFGQRTLQSYIIAGHNRGQILLAKLIAYQIACMTILALPLLVHGLIGRLLLINLITENAPALEAKNLSPEIDLPPHSVYLNSDYSMVERILQNLLTNAIRYSSGDIKMSLKQARENRAIFTIKNPIDSKTEINPARLFERFYTGDASRHNSGTGVGLAVVKLLTDKLGGNVSAEIKSNVLTVTLEIQ